MAKVVGSTDSVIEQGGVLTEGIGFPLLSIDTSSGTVVQEPPDSVLVASSTATQTPSGLDTPIQIEFGPAQHTGADPVALSAAGAVTINQVGTYDFIMTLPAVRSGGGGNTLSFIRALKNGVQIGNPISMQINNSNTTIPSQFILTLDLVVSDVVTAEFYRDSAGNNDGELASNPSTIGWGNSPSAAVRVLKIN